MNSMISLILGFFLGKINLKINLILGFFREKINIILVILIMWCTMCLKLYVVLLNVSCGSSFKMWFVGLFAYTIFHLVETYFFISLFSVLACVRCLYVLNNRCMYFTLDTLDFNSYCHLLPKNSFILVYNTYYY